MRGDRFGIVGPNGAGKNLLNLLTGALMPDTRRGPARHQPEQIDRAGSTGRWSKVATIASRRCANTTPGAAVPHNRSRHRCADPHGAAPKEVVSRPNIADRPSEHLHLPALPDRNYNAIAAISSSPLAGINLVVLRGLDPRIHAFVSGARRRGWPGQARPGRIREEIGPLISPRIS